MRYVISLVFTVLLFSGCGGKMIHTSVRPKKQESLSYRTKVLLAKKRYCTFIAGGAVFRENTPTIRIKERRLYGRAGCNQYLARCTIQGNRISIRVLKTENRMCSSPEVQNMESWFIRYLESVETWKLHGEYLHLISKGTVVLSFTTRKPW